MLLRVLGLARCAHLLADRVAKAELQMLCLELSAHQEQVLAKGRVQVGETKSSVCLECSEGVIRGTV